MNLSENTDAVDFQNIKGVYGTGTNLKKMTLRTLEMIKTKATFIDSFMILFKRDGLIILSFMQEVYRRLNKIQMSFA